MNQQRSQPKWIPVIAVFFGFFIMGFVDIVGIATNYVKIDFDLSNSLANTLPMIVFLGLPCSRYRLAFSWVK